MGIVQWKYLVLQIIEKHPDVAQTIVSFMSKLK